MLIGLGDSGLNTPRPAVVRDYQAVSGSSAVETGDKRYEICSGWHLGGTRIRGTVNGQPFAAQVERGVGKNPLAIRIIHNGTRLDAMDPDGSQPVQVGLPQPVPPNPPTQNPPVPNPPTPSDNPAPRP